MGCMAACHVGEPGKPYGNKDLSSEGELGDIWHMKSIRTGFIGQADDGGARDERNGRWLATSHQARAIGLPGEAQIALGNVGFVLPKSAGQAVPLHICIS
jgi:hypothetical protein